MGYLAGLYLAVVAYLYVIGEMLPKLSFLTVLDYYAYISMFFLVFIIFECVWLHASEPRDKEEKDKNHSFNRLLKIFLADLGLWVLIQIVFLCCMRRIKTLAEKEYTSFVAPKYPGGIVARVGYNINKAQYSHHKVIQPTFIAEDLPEEWSK